MWWANTVKSTVNEIECKIIDESVLRAQLDLSACLNEKSWEGKAILDFTVFACLPDDLRGYVLNVLSALMNKQMKTKSSDKLIIEHPVHTWVLQPAHPLVQK